MRRYVFLIFSLFTLLSAFSQTHYVSHVHVGVHAGVSLAEMSFSPSVKQSFSQGLTGGVSIRYVEERHVGILAELNFSQRGWAENFEESPLKYSRTLNYIDLPVMTHIFFGGRNFKGFINLGPQISYMIGSSISSNFDYENPRSDPNFPNKVRMTEQMSMAVKNKFDYGITAGLGMEAIIRRRHCVTLEARYYYGLGSIFSSTKKDTFSASRTMNIAVTLGYQFRIK
ncbi:MAG: PorT family protein [Muribaculaceae bacterium]|nr:PorT family protein [Muribaculaceae bacterium]